MSPFADLEDNAGTASRCSDLRRIIPFETSSCVLALIDAVTVEFVTGCTGLQGLPPASFARFAGDCA